VFAVIRSGGKQFKVAEGDVIEVERLDDSRDSVQFDPILIVDDKGTASAGGDLSGATVTGKVVGKSRGPKIKVFKYRSKTGYRRTLGHRQSYLKVQIDGIKAGKSPTSKAKKEEGEGDGT
jgi:large subunit ribosomal protein L21